MSKNNGMKKIEARYVDPPNKDIIINEIKQAPNLKKVLDITNKYLPGWVVTFMNAYCDDYPHLQENWVKLCLHIEIPPTQIMIVDEIIFDDNHEITRTLCELFTRCGFSVKRKLEFIPCSNCGKAVPTRFLYEKFLTDKSKKVPDEYKEKCTDC